MKTLLLNPPPKRISEKKILLVKGVLKMIKDYSPDILGITAMTHEVEMASAIDRDYKKLFVAQKLFLGGIHITALPEDTLKRYSSIDIVIIGEGELN